MSTDSAHAPGTISASSTEIRDKWGWFVAVGVAFVVLGTIAFLNVFVAIVLVASGLMRIWIGIKERPGNNWGWIVAAGVVTLILGIIVALGWPVNSLWVLGLFLAVDLIFQGWSFIAFGLALRSRDTGAGFRAA